MKKLLRCLVLTAGLMTGVAAQAEEYPTRPIRIITGFGAGGIGFAVPRMFGEEMSRILNQRIVHDDRPGAGNLIGARVGAKAQPDGYNLFIGGLAMHPLLQRDGIDLTKQMRAVGLVLEVPLVFATSKSLPLGSVEALARYARANPRKLNFASSGGSRYLSLMMALLAERAGRFTYVNVPYKSASEIQIGFSTGDVHVSLVSVLSIQAPMKRGEVTPILVAGPARSPLLPNVPTPAEAGIRNFSVETLFGLWVPLGTPEPLVRRLNAAANEAATTPAYRTRLQKSLGVVPAVASPEQALERFQQQLRLIEEAVRIEKLVAG